MAYKNKYCKCGILIWNTSNSCNSCSTKERYKNPKNNPNYKGGITSKEYFCKCGNKIGLSSGVYGAGLCKVCAHIGENNPNYKDGRCSKQYYCIENCGREISYNNWKKGNKRCLSCNAKYLFKVGIINNSGKNNGCWQGGKSFEPYTLEFTKKLKEQIRQRDNYTCQNCGMTEEEHIIVRGQVLHVHHIDYDKQNCKEDNLITLCHYCNTRANYNRNYWQSFYINKIKEIVHAS